MNIYDATETAYKNGYAKGFSDGKGEVTSEIFEEIEKHDCKPLPQIDPIYVLTVEQLAELKKKYTQEVQYD